MIRPAFLCFFVVCNVLMTLNFLMASHRSPDMASEAVIFNAPRSPEHGAPRMVQMVEKLGARLASELGFEGDDVGSEAIEEWASSSAFSAWAQSTVYAEASGAYHPSRPASFGPHISSEDGLSGRLVPASALLKVSENTCCPPENDYDLASHPHVPVGWIALIQRGKCGFAEKIRKAQAMGAIAVIVGDDADHGSMRGAMGFRQLIGMYSPDDTSDIQIPSVFVSYISYNTLLEAFETRYEERQRVSQSGTDDVVGIRVTLSRDDVDALLEWCVLFSFFLLHES